MKLPIWGIEGETVTADITELYGIPGGVIVSSVVENGPADKAGVKKGDIITELDGRSVSVLCQIWNSCRIRCSIMLPERPSPL